ncbi:hypothetical protein ST47_g3991 [Ascochyta rabiei]|uniref:Carboxylic ester hydrolase n=2 Tax=Didymella rabiei TaxID=5454 RepID=A0A163GHS6_DIDRA|nr:hypothetical protein ST47_g3991 [Ascochyta rabiei]
MAFTRPTASEPICPGKSAPTLVTPIPLGTIPPAPGSSTPSTGGEYVTKFIQLLDIDNLQDLDKVTYNKLVEWMNTGLTRYLNSLQTTVPDLTAFQSSGATLLHYHGESDPSVPAASSVHYWQSVRSTMYPDLTDAEAIEAMSEWYQFYLIPGAAHCGINSLQPGPYPQDNMATLIESGDYSGEVQRLCRWPTRPLWSGNNSIFDYVNDEASIESWTYTFNAFKLQPIW